MVKTAVAVGKLDRILLGIYLIALFGGLAMMLRWNLSANRHAVFVAVGVAFVVAAATELAQGLVAYRSAEFMDLVAGLVGAFIAVGGIRVYTRGIRGESRLQ